MFLRQHFIVGLLFLKVDSSDVWPNGEKAVANLSSAAQAEAKKRAAQLAVIQRYEMYRNGGEGCILWAEENVRVPVYRIGSSQIEYVYMKDLPTEIWPTTGRSYRSMWEEQKKGLIEALRMENGLFVHSLIIFCEPRGDGKSFKTLLIQLWRFCCWPEQDIVFCSNSKELSSFLLYKELQSVILNSPRILRVVGGVKAVQEKAIRRRDKNGTVVSTIQLISSHSGIVSNINGYSYSEFMDNKFPAFFEKLDTSTRNTPNAMGVIDTTVSSKEHKLYELYKISVLKQDPKLYFLYRFSKNGDYRDFWHPKNDQQQLDSFRVRFPMGGFARQFQNLWSAGSEKVFSQEDIDAVGYIGADNNANCHSRVVELIRRKQEMIDGDLKLRERHSEDENKAIFEDHDLQTDTAKVDARLWPVSSVYRLQTSSGVSVMADSDALSRLTDIYDTEWAIIGGIDRADPLKKGRTAARTMFTVVAKGLPGSMSNPNIGVMANNNPDDIDADAFGLDDASDKKMMRRKVRAEDKMPSLSYVYFLLSVVNIQDHSLEMLKTHISMAHEEFDGMDAVGGERYGLWDLIPWGEIHVPDTKFEIVQPNYNSQLAFFSYFFTVVNTGRFKAPPTGVAGSKLDDLIREEMAYFDHDDSTKWFG